jgi:hypothetical protein
MNVHIHDFLPESETVLWDLWYPEAGATGVPFARGRLNPTEVLWVHAAPPTLEVTVRAGNGQVIARGESLTRSGQRFPMAVSGGGKSSSIIIANATASSVTYLCRSYLVCGNQARS